MTTLNDVTAAALAYGQTQYDQGKADQVAVTAAVQAAFDAYKLSHPESPTPSPTPTPKPTSVPLIGVYMSGNNSGLDAYTSKWKSQPNVGSFYLTWGSGSAISIPALLKTYAGQGRFVHYTLNTKIAAGSWVTWVDIAAGKYDARLIALIKSLNALGSRQVLCLECEPDNQFDIMARTGKTTGNIKQGQTPAQYVAAGNHVADLIHANATHVESGIHLSGWRGNTINKQFLLAHDKLDNVGWDPYKNSNHPVAQMPGDLFSKFIKDTLVPNGYGDTARHIMETGIQVSWTSQQQKDFWNALPAGMEAQTIQSSTWFRANSGGIPYIPTDPTVDQAFGAMLASTRV